MGREELDLTLGQRSIVQIWRWNDDDLIWCSSMRFYLYEVTTINVQGRTL